MQWQKEKRQYRSIEERERETFYSKTRESIDGENGINVYITLGEKRERGKREVNDVTEEEEEKEIITLIKR